MHGGLRRTHESSRLTVWSADGPRWSVRASDTSALAVPLVVRDLFGLAAVDGLDLPRTGVPALAADRSDEAALSVLVDEWRSWWSASVEGMTPADPRRTRAGGGAVPQGRALRSLVVEHWSGIRASAAELERRGEWHGSEWQGSERRRGATRAADGLVITNIMGEIAAGLPRRPHAFTLIIETLPFVSSGLWRLGAARILASSDLETDPVGFRAALEPILRELA